MVVAGMVPIHYPRDLTDSNTWILPQMGAALIKRKNSFYEFAAAGLQGYEEADLFRQLNLPTIEAVRKATV